ncbi:uncharacterized protein B0J16DRAFT_389212 [Fusarium flagelliforme]|uniref:uncharacterized protein n=1 Tax=Fusarium flagelliforme TaxID=2675880 RepID=UPI001E8DAF6B|nr:uncharacterized protein B0J16DRAFT_389212 [Fusarium flagelliforme]KAH7173330.1 hypothetical protein B0J16DRAFT_389212 [Fusarium flagelliforme]
MAEMGSTLSIYTIAPSTSENMPISLTSCLTNGGTIKARSPVDEATKTACLQEIAKKEKLSAKSVNHILNEFSETFEGTHILSSSWLDLRYPSYDASNAPNRFIAPVLHTMDQGHWSLVFVNCETHIKQSTVRVQHYDPKPDDSRAAGVLDKIKKWADRHHGDRSKLEFENASGPQQENSKISGFFIIMAARAFVQFGHTNLVWDEEPVEYIRGILKEKRKPTLPAQEPLRPPSRDDKDGQRSSPKVPFTPRKNPALSLEYREDSFAARARTPSAATRKLAGDLAGKMTPPKTDQPLEPNSKRRRTESGSPLKYEQVISLAHSYPSLTSLKEDSEERVSDLETKQEMLRERNEASAQIAQQWKEHEEDHEDALQACLIVEGKIEKHEKAERDLLNRFPQASEDLVLSTDEIINSIAAMCRERVAPLKEEFQVKKELKRKAGDLFKSTDQKRIAVEADVRKAVEAQSLAEEEAKKAIRLHDEAEAAEEYRKKMELAKENPESSDWLQKWRDRRGGA